MTLPLKHGRKMAKRFLKTQSENPAQNQRLIKKKWQEINRLQALMAQEQTKLQKQGKNARKARTRTLIQAGGNVLKAGLFDMCGIETGDDLQDPENYHKAALLVGFLKSALDGANFTDKNIEEWRSLGELILKYDFAKRNMH